MTATLVKRMKPLLGTFVEVGAFLTNQDETVLNDVFKTIETIHTQMSFHDPESSLSKLNRNPEQWIDLPMETLSVLSKAKQLCKDSGHLFNCTLGGHLVQQRVLPNHFKHTFQTTGKASDIKIQGHQAQLKTPVLVTLDGIAKGYAVDQAIDVLKYHQITAGWVNAGGDLKVFGDLTLPVSRRHNQTEMQPLIHLKNQALASSEIHRNENQRFPGKIIDATGHQPPPDIISVMAEDAWLADGLTKVLALQSETERQATAKCFNATYLLSSTPTNRTAL